MLRCIIAILKVYGLFKKLISIYSIERNSEFSLHTHVVTLNDANLKESSLRYRCAIKRFHYIVLILIETCVGRLPVLDPF